MANGKSATSTPQLWIAGLLSLAVAMGIGRFAFTPMLPLMMREGQLDVAAGGWIAAANYVGYFVGAMSAARVPLSVPRLAVLALAATALLTAVMAWPSIPLWILWRFLAGVASAWAFVATAVWCLGALAQRGEAHFSGAVYTGVGCGIALAGAYCWLASALGASAASLWLQLGALSVVMALPVVAVLRHVEVTAPPAAAAWTESAAPSRGLVWCYGIMGFGYILPATFLPVLARNVIDDPKWFGLAWPVFGAMAAISTLVAAAWMRRSSRVAVWSHCQWAMGVGALLPSVWPSGVSIALSALLVGGTFMIITLAGVQEARARVPHAPTAAVGRMTGAFALGQIAGPVASALLLHVPALRTHGLDIALQLAAIALIASALWLRREANHTRTNQEMSHAR